jgi:hypothetical protein
MKLEFEVDVCLGRGDGGTVFVRTDVSEKEFERMKLCHENFEDFEDYPGLKRLYKRICREAIDLSIFYDGEETVDHADASCRVYLPDAVRGAK